MKRRIEAICAARRALEGAPDAQLRRAFDALRRACASGAPLARLTVRAFALAGESCRRHLGLTPYPVQYMAGCALAGGAIAQMNTGEGKTLAAIPPACLRALEGRGVHVITVNEYLARRDFEANRPVFEALGISVGLSLSGMSVKQKQAAYRADVTYATATEAGFDFLRDGVAAAREARVQRALYCASVDEADSVLLDEAVTPMILSGGGAGETKDYIIADTFVKYLKKQSFPSVDEETDTDALDCDYVVDERAGSALLTDRGVQKAERYFRVDNLFEARHLEIYHRILQALSAYGTLERDVDYIIKEGKVQIVDRSTGRVMEGRRYAAGLHQAIEAKEKLEIHQESRVLSSITYQNYFRLYPILSGMTGTAWTARRELGDTYKIGVRRIPPNRPCLRADRPDRYFDTAEEKLGALVRDAEEAYRAGRPVLIGTPNDRVSDQLDAALASRAVPHRVLSAKQDADEAKLVAGAGMPSSVVVATNMAGRGTDIRLGGGDPACAERVKALRGLLVLGSERQCSRRVDDQLIGRAGRQGDPGESRFFISREDEIIKLYGDAKRPLDAKNVRRAQAGSEAADANRRGEALRTDCVLQAFRKGFCGERNRVLEAADMLDLVCGIAEKAVDGLIARHTNPENRYASFRVAFHRAFGGDLMIEPCETIDAAAWKAAARAAIIRQKDSAPEIFDDLARAVILQRMDEGWSDFLEAFEVLKTGYHLMAAGRSDHAQVLVKAAGEALKAVNAGIALDSATRLRTGRLVKR